jgi:phosphoglycerate dehydrogenase-like enzyme
MLKIVLVGGMATLGRELIEAGLECEYSMSVIADTADIGARMDELAAADVVVGWPLTEAIVQGARHAKLLHVCGAGVDGLPFEQVPAGAVVANTYHHETAISEYILMAMLMLPRRPAEYDARLREGNWWDSCIWGREPNLGVLEGQTALLIGIGHIALEVAKRARAFGVRTVGVSRDPRGELAEIELRVGYEDWEEQLREADFVIPCCPLTAETEGLIGAAQFGRMKRSAYLINTARGKVVEEKALYEALRDGVIAGAAIDVWYRYPGDPEEKCAPSAYPFAELENVLMTPHVSAWTKRTVEGRMRDIAANIDRLAAGQDLVNVLWGGRGAGS